MSKKVVNKKIIVASNLDGKTEGELTTSFGKLQNGVATNAPSGLVTNPTPLVVAGMITDRNNFLLKKESLIAETKQNTEDIHTSDTGLKNVFTSQWATQIQNFGGITVNQIKGMGYGVKGIAGGAAETTSIDEMGRLGTTSAPVIVKIDTDVKNEHIIHTHNNLTGKRGHPKDVLEVDIYSKPGGAPPRNLADLLAKGGQLLGTSERGIYINLVVAIPATPAIPATGTTPAIPATPGNIGEPIHYIAIYKGRKTKKTIAESNVMTAEIK